jgi:thiol-disulfide isomerase/thioredoxin
MPLHVGVPQTTMTVPIPRRRLLIAATLGLAAGASTRAQGEARVVWRDITLLDGRTLPAKELARKVVVVEIWASWCPFCARQNPHLQKLHEATRDTDLQILTFTIDERPADAVKYLKAHGYTFPAAVATPQVEAWFGRRRSLPELYVVDANGRIVQREPGEMFPEDVAALARYARARAP